MTDIEIEDRAREVRNGIVAKLGKVRLIGADIEALDTALAVQLKRFARDVLRGEAGLTREAAAPEKDEEDDDDDLAHLPAPRAARAGESLVIRQDGLPRGEIVPFPIELDGKVAVPLETDYGAGRRTIAMVPMAPDDLRKDLAATRRRTEEQGARFTTRLNDAPIPPEREMRRAFLDDGTLDVWFDKYAHWLRKMRADFER